MPIFNGVPQPDTNVNYDGYTLPKDKEPVTPVPVETDVNYAGYNLPAQKVTSIPFVTPQSNNPANLYLGNIGFITGQVSNNDPVMILPGGKGLNLITAGVQILPKDEKILAESQIIDGVSVFEHINRRPVEFDIEILLWKNGYGVAFPQQTITTIWDNLWMPNTVQKVQNTFMNGIHVQEVIIKSISPMPRLGSTNVILKLKVVENQAGQSLIIGNTLTLSF
jgi:hypothetical protein